VMRFMIDLLSMMRTKRHAIANPLILR